MASVSDLSRFSKAAVHSIPMPMWMPRQQLARVLEEDARPRPQIGVSKDNQPRQGLTHDDEDDDDEDFMRCDVQSIKEYFDGNSGDFMTPKGKTYCAEYNEAMEESKNVGAVKCACFKEVPRVDADLFFKCWWPFDDNGATLPMGQRDLIFHKWEDCQTAGKPKKRGSTFNPALPDGMGIFEPRSSRPHPSIHSSRATLGASLSLGAGMGVLAGMVVVVFLSGRARRSSRRQGIAGSHM